jgi:hypothetical protein
LLSIGPTDIFVSVKPFNARVAGGPPESTWPLYSREGAMIGRYPVMCTRHDTQTAVGSDGQSARRLLEALDRIEARRLGTRDH